MAIKPDLVIDYVRELQQVILTPERAQVVAGELERLVNGVASIAAETNVADDPADFLAALAELRDTSDE